MPAHWCLLTEFLFRADGDVRLSWAELDAIVGGMPASAVNHYPQWWHGDRPNTRAWRAAGYEAIRIDPGVSVLFVPRDDPQLTPTSAPYESRHTGPARHVTAPVGAAGVLGALDPDRALIVIPCSASKRRGGRPEAPSPAPAVLAPARRSVLAVLTPTPTNPSSCRRSSDMREVCTARAGRCLLTLQPPAGF